MLIDMFFVHGSVCAPMFIDILSVFVDGCACAPMLIDMLFVYDSACAPMFIDIVCLLMAALARPC